MAFKVISPVAPGITATRSPGLNPSRASHWPWSRILGCVLRRKKSPAISIFNERVFIGYPFAIGRAARCNGLPLVSYPLQWRARPFALERVLFHRAHNTQADWVCKHNFKRVIHMEWLPCARLARFGKAPCTPQQGWKTNIRLRNGSVRYFQFKQGGRQSALRRWYHWIK